MKLPGGLLVDGQLRCDFNFKSITGLIEREIIESNETAGSLAVVLETALVTQVTNILNITLANVAGMPANKDLVSTLCSGDRQYLIIQLEAIINPASKWLTIDCHACGELIQLKLIPGTLPVKPAGQNFPTTTTHLSIGEVMLRAPNGADEMALLQQPNNEKQRLSHLLKRLISQSNKPIDIEQLTTDDTEIIDQILENMMPQPSIEISTACPYCDSLQEITLDIYQWMNEQSNDIENDIHQLAINYHWSEKEILALPKTRRKHYLQLIEQASHQEFEQLI